MVRPSRRREMARWAVENGRTSIRHACQTFALSETGYRYQAKAREENARIADWLTAAKAVPGSVIGVMYTTWQNKFGDLEKFAEVVKANARD